MYTFLAGVQPDAGGPYRGLDCALSKHRLTLNLVWPTLVDLGDAAGSTSIGL